MLSRPRNPHQIRTTLALILLVLANVISSSPQSHLSPHQHQQQQPRQQVGGSHHPTGAIRVPLESEDFFEEFSDEPEQREEQLAYLAPPPGVPFIFQGAPVDLVALNRRRFELEHDHDSTPSEHALKRSQFIEAKIAAVPEQLLAALPDELSREVLDSVASETSLNLGEGSAVAGAELISSLAAEDPDGASIERLTKSCLTVHASSTRPEQLNVTFHLYTRSNPHVPYIMRPQISRLEMLKSSPLDPSKPIKWITHGFHTNVDKSEWMVATKNKILTFEDSNVVLTDWRRGASPALAFYPKAAANAHVVAMMIVKILRRLRQDTDFSQIHLIGHSLGAHIMGFVGSAFTEEFLHQQQQLLVFRERPPHSGAGLWRGVSAAATSGSRMSEFSSNWANQLIGRITACDPALPCFGPSSSAPAHHTPPVIVPPGSDAAPSSAGPAPAQSFYSTESSQQQQQSGEQSDWTPTMWTHLRPDSAVVVEVMHSNPGVMGYADPLGDYDFYPNGFERQPGCGLHPSSIPQQSAATSSSSPASVLQPQQQSVNESHKRFRRQAMGTRLVNSLVSSMMREPRPHPTGGHAKQQQQQQGDHLRLSSTFNKLIKPIRDFFHGYTCSHHRAVEYMVESMYYERIPQDRKLDRDFVCQLVGYQCADYASFKRGFCFRCANDLDCRALTMSVFDEGSIVSRSQLERKFSRNSQQAGAGATTSPVSKRSLNATLSASSIAVKRAMPVFNNLHHRYRPQTRLTYYFDTRATKDYCLHHYHLLVKYRWARIREGITLNAFQLAGTLANISQRAPVSLHKHTPHSYTMLLTDGSFLGQIESLLVVGDKLRPSLVDYIEITYMSNLDARVRSLGSARLCRLNQSHASNITAHLAAAASLIEPQASGAQLSSASFFVRCTGRMV